METKNWLESLTIRGQLVQVLPALYAITKMVGFSLPDGVLEALVDGLSALAFVAGAAMVFVGRFRAKHTLTI